MKTAIVIPARYGSTRFPGKPLAAIAGRTMLARVVDVARAAARVAGASVTVATDDRRIADAAAGLGVEVVMTPPDLVSGTDRTKAALDLVASPAAFAINLQGDAPFTPPRYLIRLMEAARGAHAGADVVTPVTAMDWDALDALRRQKETAPFSGTTCVRHADGRAIWFSKNILPAMRDEAALRRAGDTAPVWRHIGLYGYRRAALDAFCSWPPSPYERLEGLEQLRFLEHGATVAAIEVEPSALAMSGIDTPQDIEIAEALIRAHGDPGADLIR